jgi:hypothetical protein
VNKPKGGAVDVDRLAEIAAQLVGRVRDDVPEANARWLQMQLPDPADWFRLCFALACAVPDDRSWNSLVHWTQVMSTPMSTTVSTVEVDEGAADHRVSKRRLRPHGTPAAAARHRYHREPMCDACKDWDAGRKRTKRQAA